MGRSDLSTRTPASRWFWGVAALTLIPLTVLAWRFAVPAEDAVILYDYARNLATTGVISYGGHATPIEGATDFLWMLLIAVGARVGAPEFATALVLTLVATAGLCRLFRRTVDRWILLAALLATPFLYASLSGFSAIAFSAAFVLALSLALSGDIRVYPAVLLLSLIRPDGVAWGLGCVGYRLWTQSGERTVWRRELLWLFGALLVPGALYFFWRAWYFSEWLPLPFLVKSTANPARFFFRPLSIAAALLVAVPAAVALLAGGRRRDAILWLGVFAAPFLFYASVRLEQNIGNRFLAPMFFGTLFLLCRQTTPRVACAFVVAAVLTHADITGTTMRMVAESQSERVAMLAAELQPYPGRMLVTEAGRLAYYSRWTVDDSWGLNTPRYAHVPIAADDVARGGYDLIVAHCPFEIIDAPADPAPRTIRSWDNQCRAIAAGIKQPPYRLWIVPFADPDAGLLARVNRALGRPTSNDPAPCRRHDVYGVSTTAPHADQIESVLKRYGGLPYAAAYRRAGDDLVCAPSMAQ